MTAPAQATSDQAARTTAVVATSASVVRSASERHSGAPTPTARERAFLWHYLALNAGYSAGGLFGERAPWSFQIFYSQS